ncbi:MAG: outer membrane lipoprotein carrier protein LolA, partial [Bacteroidota bacterium]
QKPPYIWFLFFLVAPGFILEENANGDQDNKAEQIVAASRSGYYKTRDMSLDFVYEVKGVTSRLSRQKGTLKLQQKKYVLKMREQETYCDGNKVWVYLPRYNEYMVFNYGEWSYGSVMSLFYSMYYGPSEKTYQGLELQDDGRKAHKIRFRMSNQSPYFSTAYAWYAEKTNQLTRVTFLDRRRRQRSFFFSNRKINSGFNQGIFVFHPEDHPDIELRR